MVMAPMLRAARGSRFSETDLVAGPRAAVLAGPLGDPPPARRDDPALVVVAGPVGRGRLADELGEAGGERSEARTADGKADVGHAHVAVSKQRLGPLDPARHQVRVGRLGIRL